MNASHVGNTTIVSTASQIRNCASVVDLAFLIMEGQQGKALIIALFFSLIFCVKSDCGLDFNARQKDHSHALKAHGMPAVFLLLITQKSQGSLKYL